MSDPTLETRPDGWYFVKPCGRSEWVAAWWDQENFLAGKRIYELHFLVDEVGTRIPSPDEQPAERSSRPVEPLCCDPQAPVVQCVICKRDVYTCELGESVNGSYACPAHPDGVELSKGGQWVCSEACWDAVCKIAELEQDRERLRKAVTRALGNGPGSIVWGNHPYDKGFCNAITTALTCFDDECKRIDAARKPDPPSAPPEGRQL